MKDVGNTLQNDMFFSIIIPSQEKKKTGKEDSEKEDNFRLGYGNKNTFSVWARNGSQFPQSLYRKLTSSGT